TSAEASVVIVSPQVTGTTPGSRCGAGDVTLGATGSAGTTLRWYSASTGGSPLATGNSFTTSVPATTNFYVEAYDGSGGGSASPVLVTEMDLGTNDQLEIQNVSSNPVDVTGWKVVVSNDYANINTVNPIPQTLSGVMNPGDTKTWTDLATAPNYWGNNILWN